MELFEEGEIRFFAENKQTRDSEVFFNPTRRFDRDLNVLLVRALGRTGMHGIDLFAGSGVRSLRLASETGCFKSFVINDIKTAKIITKNVSLNKRKIHTKIKVSPSNAMDIYNSKEGYDYLDIDPFGSPIKYLMYAMPKVKYGGVLAVTATDSAALYGKAKKACELKYGAFSFKTSYFNEIGLRILIKRTEEIANMHDRSIEPTFFDVRRHYLRVYLRVKRASTKRKMGYLYQCSGCPNRAIEPSIKCANCGAKMLRIGPLWLDALFDRGLALAMHKLAEEGEGKEYLNTLAAEEDIVSYYTTTELASYMKQPEKQIGLIGTRTVLNDKGFRTRESFKELLEKYKGL